MDDVCHDVPALPVGPPQEQAVRLQRDTHDVPVGEHRVRVELRRGAQVLLQASGTATVRASTAVSAGCEQQVRRASLRYDPVSGALHPSPA